MLEFDVQLIIKCGFRAHEFSTIEKIEFVYEYFKCICPVGISISCFRLTLILVLINQEIRHFQIFIRLKIM